MATAIVAAMAGTPGAHVTVPAGQTVANAGASQSGPQAQQGRLPAGPGFLQAMLGSGGGGYAYGFERPRYRKRPHGSVARDIRTARKARNRLRMKGRR